MRDRYAPEEFEAAWRQRWKEADLFATREEAGRPKFYGLDFFPYPSGAGLSVGHCRNYIPTDVICRVKYMQGHNVLHPMGFDAFGLPAENEAIKNRTHPGPMVERYAETYRRQMELIGISYDWSRAVNSSDPSYYRWTQWIFKLLYDRGLAYRKLAAVNWCPKDKTALANEEVVGGLCDRCGTPVEKREIPQWFFRITEYAQRLIDDLDKVDWPEGIKQMQRNWIGRSEGVEFEMRLVFDGPADTPKAPGAATDPELAALAAEVEAEGTGVADAEALAKARELAERAQAAAVGAVNSPALADATARVDAYADDFLIKSPTRREAFRVFTTRIDTIFGVTFCVLAPEHPLVEVILKNVEPDRRAEIEAYRQAAGALSDVDRQATTHEKTGVFTGAYAVNPANGQRVPVYIADYVLMGYGTGAIMAVPGHDERDFAFAQKYGIPVTPVIAPDPGAVTKLPYAAKDGILINSGSYDGMTVAEAQTRLGEWMEALDIGERKVNYKLRDWLISRQRYWGCPIPVVYDAEGDMETVPDDALPVHLPDVDNYEPTDDGQSPLAAIPDFVNVTTRDGRLGRRETDTMGGFACSSWYFLRFCDPHNADCAWDPERVAAWMPVDTYVGGAEHAVMHLLYARFWTKVLFDAGLVPVDEPFHRLMNQGMLLAPTPYRHPRADERLGVGEEGVMLTRDEAAAMPETDVFYRWEKMSKSKGNVVTPDEAVAQYGADALRVFELFVAPFEQAVQWSEEGMQGSVRFLSRVFRLASELAPHYDPLWRDKIGRTPADGVSADVRRATHQAIAKATADIERFAFNTYIAALMTYSNRLSDAARQSGPTEAEALAFSEALATLVLLLSPAAPHTADEIWAELGQDGFTYEATWPVADPALAAADTVTVAVQVNGKLRDTVELPADADQAALEAAALASEKVRAHTDGKTVRKVIVVPGKLVNIVAN